MTNNLKILKRVDQYLKDKMIWGALEWFQPGARADLRSLLSIKVQLRNSKMSFKNSKRHILMKFRNSSYRLVISKEI